MQRYLIIHYGEIFLKGENRDFFIKQLINNINQVFADYSGVWLKHLANRIIILLEDEYDLGKIKTELKKVFGIEYFAFAWNSKQDYKKIEANILDLVKEEKFKTFRISARRTNKKYPKNSQQLEIDLGAAVVEKFKKKVDLEEFDLEVHLDIVREFAFIYFEKHECFGGLPVGVSGKLLCLLSGGIDSPVAANLMQKRGASIVYINFDSYPSTPKENQGKVKDLVKVLNQYQFNSKLYLVPFLKIQKEVVKKVPAEYRVVFYRRMMLRIARKIALKENILALVTGESLGQVASQTIENIWAINEAIDLPILRPLIGFNKEEISNIAQKINTYDISIQPFADCCSLFVPRHPVTKADLNLILDTEKDWDFQPLLEEAAVEAETFEF